MESFSDADWSATRRHCRSTSCGVHLINAGFMFASSRSQKVVSLSSCESDLQSIASCVCNGIFIKVCAKFAFGKTVQHLVFAAGNFCHSTSASCPPAANVNRKELPYALTHPKYCSNVRTTFETLVPEIITKLSGISAMVLFKTLISLPLPLN